MQILPVLTTTVLVGVGAATGALAQAVHPDTGEALAQDQTFVYQMLVEPETIDPQRVGDSIGFAVARDLFEGLMNQRADGTLEPGVATGYVANDTNDVFTFTLRDDARWSNGDPVTAHDFVYGARRAADPATASHYGWFIELAGIENATEVLAGEMPVESLGVVAIDDHTLEYRLENIVPYFPLMTVFATMFPAHQATIEQHGDQWIRPENIVSNGAYTLSEHVVGDRLVRTKSDTYWDADNVIITETTGRVITDLEEGLADYLAGDLDFAGIPGGQYPKLAADYPDEATSVPRLCTYYYALNQSKRGPAQLQDPRVRRALSLAIDRDAIVDRILQGGQRPAYNLTHHATAEFDMPEIDYGLMTQAERDAEAARFLAEAGADDLELELIHRTGEPDGEIARLVADMWQQKLGVTSTLADYEWTAYVNVRGGQEFDVAGSSWCGDYNEASTFLDLLTTNNGINDGRYSNPEVDRLLEEARLMADPQPNYTRVEEILAEDMAVIPIHHYASVFMLKPDIKGWPYDNVENNWYSRELYRVASDG
ncbi:MAG: peptide ABC transporter substrate-binding protein [Pseudomonadota bacterium]